MSSTTPFEIATKCLKCNQPFDGDLDDIICSDCADEHGVCRKCGVETPATVCATCKGETGVFDDDGSERGSTDDEYAHDDASETENVQCVLCEKWLDAEDVASNDICRECYKRGGRLCVRCNHPDYVVQDLCDACIRALVWKCRGCAEVRDVDAYDLCAKCSGQFVETVLQKVSNDEELKKELTTNCNTTTTSSSQESEEKKQPVQRRVLVIEGHGGWDKHCGYTPIPEGCTFTVLGPYGSVLDDDAAVVMTHMLAEQQTLDAWVRKVKQDGVIVQYTTGGSEHWLCANSLYPMTFCRSGPPSDKETVMGTLTSCPHKQIPNFRISLDKNKTKMKEGIITPQGESLVSIRGLQEETMLLSQLFARCGTAPTDYVYMGCAGSEAATYTEFKDVANWPGRYYSSGLASEDNEGLEEYQNGTILNDRTIVKYGRFGDLKVVRLEEQEQNALVQELVGPKDRAQLHPGEREQDLLTYSGNHHMVVYVHDAVIEDFEDGEELTFVQYCAEEELYDDALHVLLLWSPGYGTLVELCKLESS